MNVLDLLLLLLTGLAVASGWRLGLVARGTSFIGLAAGLGLAAFIAPLLLGFVEREPATTRLLVLVLTVFTSGMIGSTIGQVAGLRIRRRFEATRLGRVDHVAGGVSGVLSIAVAAWLVLPAFADVPGTMSGLVRGSTIVHVIEQIAPPPPDTVRALRQLVAQSRFPDVFANLQRAPEVGPPPSELPVAEGVVDAAVRSTVNVEAFGCGGRFEGSGFAIGASRIVTNAHVVAGADEVRVRQPDGPVLAATVVSFDEDSDLALLDVPAFDRAPIPLEEASEGAEGAVIGYPGGQDSPRIASAAVRREQVAVGRDIYGRGQSERDILVLSARLRQGDSGAVLINGSGAAIGVIFAVSPDHPNTAFALDTSELDEFLSRGETGGPGPCI